MHDFQSCPSFRSYLVNVFMPSSMVRKENTEMLMSSYLFDDFNNVVDINQRGEKA